MQFKSIVAVLALAVAVSSTPVEPVGVKLVERTTQTPQQACENVGKVASKCTLNGVLQTASTSASLISVISAIVGPLLGNLQCTIGGNSVPVDNKSQVLCCSKQTGDNTNNQSGPINVNIQNSGSVADCSPVTVL
ncbi:hypothetical protein MMC31_000583 [Peltigera leucophlebia]|nr:hypothetical protein [Peltigera leucophlebia]